MTNPPPPPQQPYPGQEPYVAPSGDLDEPKKGKWSGCLIGCLVVFGLCSVMCAGVGFYAYSNMSTWVTTAARETVKQILKDSDLPQEEQTAILAQFERVVTAYEEGELTLEELGESMQKLVESPLIGLVMMQAVEAKYLNPSGLSEEEKEEAKQILARVVRGALEKTLQKEDIDKVTQHFLEPNQNNNQQPQLKPSLTDEELRAMIAEAKEIVDSAGIPDEEYDVKVSEVVTDIVDEILAE